MGICFLFGCSVGVEVLGFPFSSTTQHRITTTKLDTSIVHEIIVCNIVPIASIPLTNKF